MVSEILTATQLEEFERDGFVIVKGLFSEEEITEMREHFMKMHAAGPVVGQFEPKTPEEAGGDALAVYPRFMHPHRQDKYSRDMMLHPRFQNILKSLMGEEPVAAQSMFYYKPPGGRGQALHQDNFYLAVAPGSCMAAWVAVDDIDPENGGLFVVPGSHKTPVQCPHRADLAKSFSNEEVDLPSGMELIPTVMAPGDVLFFNGSLIHGSSPNSSDGRFRRSFICHYLGNTSAEISRWYFPLFRFDGTALEPGDSAITAVEEGGFCGSEDKDAPILTGSAVFA